MARVKSMGLRNYIGKLGGAVYYMNKGQNIGRELAPEISNPRTYAQMRQRMKWANLVNTYKANKSWMGRLSFESKPQTWSDYNAFMSANLYAQPCYLTKQEAEQGGIWLAPYTMTKGSLPSIQCSFVTISENPSILTDIVVKNSFSTVSALSVEILANNSGWREGDQLSFIFESDVWSQNTDIRVFAIEIILDTNDSTPLSSIPFIESVTMANVLAKSDSDALYFNLANVAIKYKAVSAGCVIHSRTVEGKTYVSTQSYVLSEEAYDNYLETGTEEALQEAIASYGESTEYFLDARKNERQEAPVISSMIGTYEDPGSAQEMAFTLVRGGANTFQQGDQDTSTNIILTTSVPLDEDEYTLAFVKDGTDEPIGAPAANPFSSKSIFFSFDYSNAGLIEGQAGTFKLYHSDVASGDPIGEFPVTAD